jgi:hypothetical protein
VSVATNVFISYNGIYSQYHRFITIYNVIRIFIDECHELWISPEFRSGFLRLWDLSNTSTQRVYFTATLPVRFMQSFMETAALHASFTTFIRGPTNRPEIRYHAVRVNSKLHSIHSVVINLAQGLQKAYFGPESRGIIFASRVEDAEEVSRDLDAFQHHKNLDAKAKEDNMSNWKDGVKWNAMGKPESKPWMVATPGLINGVDLPRVDGVIFYEEGMAGLFGGVQGSGRGGRTGHPSMCFFVTSGTFNPKVTEEDRACVKDMATWTRDDMCLRLTPSRVMDGKPVTCGSLAKVHSNTEYCGFCVPNTAMMKMVHHAVNTATKPSHLTDVSGLDDFSDLPMDCFLGIIPSETFSSHNQPASDHRLPSTAITRFGSLDSISPTSTATTIPCTPGDQSASVMPSLAIQMNLSMAQSIHQAKLKKTDIVNKLILRVRNHCYSCYILTGQYRAKDHHRIIGCKLGCKFGMGWMNFKASWITKLQRYHFCTSCGVPQDVSFKPYGPTAHEGFGKACNVEDLIPTMIFAIKRHPETWLKAAKAANLPTNISDEQFADWVKGYTMNTANYYNGLELVIWVIQNLLHHN